MGVVTDLKPRFFSGVEADRGSVPTVELNTGDVYLSTDTKAAYRWDGAAWKGPVPADWITATMLKTDSVTTDKIVALNVTNGKIGLLAVDTPQLQALAVEEAKIGALAVTNGKLGLLSVAAAQLQTDAVETLKIKDLNVTVDKLALDARCSFGRALLHIQDQKASGTDSGTFTQGVWRTRVLNIVLTNEISGASLSSNQITLPAGDYFIIAYALAYRLNQHAAKLKNVTDASDELIGQPGFSAPGSDLTQGRSVIHGRFTIGAEKVFELQHLCQTTRINNGFGIAGGFGVTEIYSDVMIWKV